MTKFYSIVDRESTNPNLNKNGGDYDFGRIVAVENNIPVAVKYWTSAKFEYCQKCGRFERPLDQHMERFHDQDERAHIYEAKGWNKGELMENYNIDANFVKIAL